jgi:DNA polymerase III delta prime subunit
MQSKKLWTFEYEPQSLNEMIVAPDKKPILQKIINELPNTLIAGKPGTGKGTFMNILIKSKDVDVIKINGSDETGVDVMRDKVKSFATAYSPKIKIVYINEADRLSKSAMDMLLQLLEDVQHITRFFFVCNKPEKMSDPLLSRCVYKIDLNNPPAKEIFAHLTTILKKEKVVVKDKAGIINIIKKQYPDVRQIIGTIQSNVIDGAINKVSYKSYKDVFETVWAAMRDSDIEKVRKCLKSNYIDYSELFEHIYSVVMDDPDQTKNPGEFILLTGEYLYKDAIVSVREINFMAYFFDLMKKGVV